MRKGLKEGLFGGRERALRPVNVMDIKENMREAFSRQCRENLCRG